MGSNFPLHLKYNERFVKKFYQKQVFQSPKSCREICIQRKFYNILCLMYDIKDLNNIIVKLNKCVYYKALFSS